MNETGELNVCPEPESEKKSLIFRFQVGNLNRNFEQEWIFETFTSLKNILLNKTYLFRFCG